MREKDKMGKGSRLRRKKRREKEKGGFKNRKPQHESPFMDLYGYNILPIDNGLPEHITFMVK